MWGKAHELAIAVYKVTKNFPKEELYGLTSQVRRACVSISANLAEGCGRSGGAELARFAQISLGSASELEYHFLLSHDLGYLYNSNFDSLTNQVTEVKRMLTAFTQKLRADR